MHILKIHVSSQVPLYFCTECSFRRHKCVHSDLNISRNAADTVTENWYSHFHFNIAHFFPIRWRIVAHFVFNLIGGVVRDLC